MSKLTVREKMIELLSKQSPVDDMLLFDLFWDKDSEFMSNMRCEILARSAMPHLLENKYNDEIREKRLRLFNEDYVKFINKCNEENT